MKIAYVGIDLLKCVLDTVLDSGCEVIKLFTCHTDNVTEFNTGVIDSARRAGIPYTLDRIKHRDLDELACQGCELLLCAGYYYRLPLSDAFAMVNVHPAPLPEYRGAWPMPVMLLRGERMSGVTIHKIASSFDTGDILLEQRFALYPDDTLEDYMTRLNCILPDMTRRLLNDLPELLVTAQPQGIGEYVPMPVESDWTVTPDMSVERADAILRAFYGYECIYRDDEHAYELIGGRALPGNAEPGGGLPVRGGFVRARTIKEL